MQPTNGINFMHKDWRVHFARMMEMRNASVKWEKTGDEGNKQRKKEQATIIHK